MPQTSVVVLGEYQDTNSYTPESVERDCQFLRAEREALQQRGVRIDYRSDGWLLSGPEGDQVVYLPLEMTYWSLDANPSCSRNNAILFGHLRALNLFDRALLLAQLVGASV